MKKNDETILVEIADFREAKLLNTANSALSGIEYFYSRTFVSNYPYDICSERSISSCYLFFKFWM